MPRKKPKTKKTPATYFKAKNGRFYKKVVIDGKTRCRFVSNAEALGTVVPPKVTKTKPKVRFAKKPKADDEKDFTD